MLLITPAPMLMLPSFRRAERLCQPLLMPRQSYYAMFHFPLLSPDAAGFVEMMIARFLFQMLAADAFMPR